VLGLFGLQAGFDQIDQDAARGGVTGFGQGADAIGDAGRKRDALPDGLLRCSGSNGLINAGHDSILRQFGEAGAVGWARDVQE